MAQFSLISDSKNNLFFMELSSLHQSLECPICKELFVDPTILPCGHTFCESCIQPFHHHKKCTICKTVTCGSQLRKNYVLYNLIQDMYPELYKKRKEEIATSEITKQKMVYYSISKRFVSIRDVVLSALKKNVLMHGKDVLELVLKQQVENLSYIIYLIVTENPYEYCAIGNYFFVAKGEVNDVLLQIDTLFPEKQDAQKWLPVLLVAHFYTPAISQIAKFQNVDLEDDDIVKWADNSKLDWLKTLELENLPLISPDPSDDEYDECDIIDYE
jgi:hypothetical protein